jgi:hypothetical protein
MLWTAFTSLKGGYFVFCYTVLFGVGPDLPLRLICRWIKCTVLANIKYKKLLEL